MTTAVCRWLVLGIVVLGSGLTACYPGEAGENGIPEGTRAVFPLGEAGLDVKQDALLSWLDYMNNPPGPPAPPPYDLDEASHNFFLVLSLSGPNEEDRPMISGNGAVSILSTDQQQRVTSMMVTLSISDCNQCFLDGLIYWVDAAGTGTRGFSGQTQLLDLTKVATLTLVEEDSSTIVCHSLDPADDGSLLLTAVDVDNEVRFPAGQRSNDVKGDYTIPGMPLDRELQIQLFKNNAWQPIGTVTLTVPDQTMTLNFDPRTL